MGASSPTGEMLHQSPRSRPAHEMTPERGDACGGRVLASRTDKGRAAQGCVRDAVYSETVCGVWSRSTSLLPSMRGIVLEPQGERRTLRLQLSLAGARVTTQATAGPHLFGAERSRGRLDCGRAAPTFERCWSWRMPSPRTAERLAEAIWGYLSFARIARTSMRGGGVYSRSATGLALHAGTFLERALGAAQGVRRLRLSQAIRFGSGGAC